MKIKKYTNRKTRPKNIKLKMKSQLKSPSKLLHLILISQSAIKSIKIGAHKRFSKINHITIQQIPKHHEVVQIVVVVIVVEAAPNVTRKEKRRSQSRTKTHGSTNSTTWTVLSMIISWSQLIPRFQPCLQRKIS